MSKIITKSNIRSKNLITCFHQNVRSIKGSTKFEEMIASIHDISTDIDIIAMTETWIPADTVGFYNLNGYNKEYFSRNDKRGGGILLFIKEKLQYIQRTDLELPVDSCESVAISIKGPQAKNLLFVVVYRPPLFCSKRFTESLESLFESAEHFSEVLVMGDMNINYFHGRNSAELRDVLDSFSMINAVQQPTRPSSGSCLGHAYIRHNPVHLKFTSNCESDHLGIILSSNFAAANTPKGYYKKLDLNLFEENLISTNWASFYDQSDVNSACNMLVAEVTTSLRKAENLKNAATKRKI